MEPAILRAVSINHSIVASCPGGILNGHMGRITGLQIGNQGGIHHRIGFAEQLAVGKTKALIGRERLVHSGGGGFLGTFKPYNEYDKYSAVIKLSAGLLMEFGDINNKPFILGIGPGTGLGYVDMDLVLPIEFRFGRQFSNNWYIMGELVYGVSLAKETRCIEPAIRVGYNFGHKAKKKK